jgi:chaperone BCS1
MTTNHYSRLDPALIRPGRVDLHELLDDAAGEQASRLFRKFYGNTNTSTPRAGASVSASQDQDQEVKGRVRLEGEEVLSDQEVERLAEVVGGMVDAEKAEGRRVSMASLQGHFIRHGARESLDGVKELCKAVKVEGA